MLILSHMPAEVFRVYHGPNLGDEATLHYDTYCHQGPSAMYIYNYSIQLVLGVYNTLSYYILI